MGQLLERRVAWRALQPRRRASVALAGHCHAYELVGAIRQALEEFEAARRLVASWLRSNTTDEMWLVADDLGVRIKDFALDPAQDFIVLLEHRPAVDPIASERISDFSFLSPWAYMFTALKGLATTPARTRSRLAPTGSDYDPVPDPRALRRTKSYVFDEDATP
jgi:hypothetical protein